MAGGSSFTANYIGAKSGGGGGGGGGSSESFKIGAGEVASILTGAATATGWGAGLQVAYSVYKIWDSKRDSQKAADAARNRWIDQNKENVQDFKRAAEDLGRQIDYLEEDKARSVAHTGEKAEEFAGQQAVDIASSGLFSGFASTAVGTGLGDARRESAKAFRDVAKQIKERSERNEVEYARKKSHLEQKARDAQLQVDKAQNRYLGESINVAREYARTARPADLGADASPADVYQNKENQKRWDAAKARVDKEGDSDDPTRPDGQWRVRDLGPIEEEKQDA